MVSGQQLYGVAAAIAMRAVDARSPANEFPVAGESIRAGAGSGWGRLLYDRPCSLAGCSVVPDLDFLPEVQEVADLDLVPRLQLLEADIIATRQ